MHDQPIVVVGDALIDLLREDGEEQAFVGGAALNVAVGLAILGHRVQLIAMVGDDEHGEPHPRGARRARGRAARDRGAVGILRRRERARGRRAAVRVQRGRVEPARAHRRVGAPSARRGLARGRELLPLRRRGAGRRAAGRRAGSARPPPGGPEPRAPACCTMRRGSAPASRGRPPRRCW
ncbi:PfkB family carbohydrate kinase [Clavibacter zhangzhiyongii]|uniref:PfkB family carbohydrate kinase n=1 Tax=Clavibacter zhangzhiyongii TaxID=2768071 RepID=UPI0039E1884C